MGWGGEGLGVGMWGGVEKGGEGGEGGELHGGGGEGGGGGMWGEVEGLGIYSQNYSFF